MLKRLFLQLAKLIVYISPVVASCQEISAPTPQPGVVTGTVMDIQSGIIPGAAIVANGPTAVDHLTAASDDNGTFVLRDVHPGIPYRITVSASGFADWTSPETVLGPGQQLELTDIKLRISTVETSVAAVTIEQLALEQVRAEEKQRVLGIVPNYFVTYDPNVVPMTKKLKFEMSLKVATDPVTLAAAAFLAGLNQAAGTPDYVQGAKGYGQRFGASYANGVTDTIIGGAVLPSLLHQDPRYFYQGTGTTKSRLLHAMSSPFLCKGDNGKWQFNYSSLGGDLASGALANLYYPDSNRGPGLVFSVFGVDTGGRIAMAIAQEFILRKLTPSANKHP